MRIVRVLLRCLLLILLCLCLSAPLCTTSDAAPPCLVGEHQPRLRQRSESFSGRAAADAAQARALLSPTVFAGTLKSVLVQRDGTTRAWFTVDNLLKTPEDTTTRYTRASSSADLNRFAYTTEYFSPPAVRPRNHSHHSQSWWSHPSGEDLPTVARLVQAPGFRRRARMVVSKKPEDTEVVYYRRGSCVLEVDQDNLRLGGQYVVFGAPVRRHAWPSLAASALPIPNEKRILRAVKKVLCEGCAKPPSVEGMQNVIVEEGSRARLQCHLAGNPIPWVEWYKDGKKITKRGRIRVKTQRRTSRLVIRRSRPSDRGVYECRAGNVVQKGHVSASAAFVVTKRRKQTTTHAPTTTTQSSPWTTEPCPLTDFCNNGGTCVFYRDVQEFVCHCAEGFVGLTCDFKDVRVSIGERKNLDPNHDRLLIIIVILFLVFFCLHWASLAICWLCCFRYQPPKNWGNFREMAPLRKCFKKNNHAKEDGLSVSVAMELTSSENSANETGSERPLRCCHRDSHGHSD